MALKPPSPTEPFQRGNALSDVWWRFFDELARAYGYTVDGIAGALAAVADVWAATSDKTFTTGLIESASAIQVLADAGPVVVNWEAFINAEVTVTANRQIGSPSNSQQGTWRTILVKGSSATPRTITFHSNFAGDIPSITDVTSTKWYLLMIYCIAGNHFVVSAKRAL